VSRPCVVVTGSWGRWRSGGGEAESADSGHGGGCAAASDEEVWSAAASTGSGAGDVLWQPRGCGGASGLHAWADGLWRAGGAGGVKEKVQGVATLLELCRAAGQRCLHRGLERGLVRRSASS
jgi:hypothetical protein